MSRDSVTQLPDADPAAIARAIVLRKLSASAKTRSELEKVLAAKNVAPEIAQAVLDRFTEVGLIDDQLYAVTWARGRHQYKGLSARSISYELGKKGVAREEVDIAVADLTAEVELATAIRFAERKLRSLQKVTADQKLHRIVGLLARKGYSSNICYAAAKQVLAVELAEAQIEFDVTELN
ncbi:MAG: regulatory protein RecX [Actinomycetota bacterium]|jgi:regulatory protein|nr:regulatory protein RecX [Actinomycetota bacterium]